jgi:hypothetical protein
VNLLSNSVTAFNHLFNQARLLDARRQAEIFTLRPRQDPFLCTMDFGKNYIIEAMKWGGSDVRTPPYRGSCASRDRRVCNAKRRAPKCAPFAGPLGG